MSTNLPDFDSLWDYEDPAGTETKFRDILPDAESSGDADYHAQLLTQIARTEGLQRMFDDAHKTLDFALKLIQPGNKTAKIRYLLERGRTYNSSNQPDKAKPLFLEAYEIGLKSKEDFYTIDAAHMMGIIEKGDESLKWNEKAIKLAESSKDERAKRWLGSLYNNTGWTYHDNKNYEKAIDYFTRNVKWHEDRGSKKPLIIAKWSVARTMRSMGKFTEALDLQMKLLKELDVMQIEQDGYVFEEIGECLLALNRKDEAKGYFKKRMNFYLKIYGLKPMKKTGLKELNY